MPITHRIDNGNRLVVARITGVLTHDDILGYHNAVWTRPDVIGYDEIVDVSDVEKIAFESSRRVSELASVAASTDSTSAPSRLAIVAPSAEAYGLARMYQTYRETTPGSTKIVKVFRSAQDAHDWLGK